jgi:glycosyltransferase involved in cell wall biosynthesis
LAPIPEEESFANVVLEAKSVGLPVVAFPSGGIPELVEDRRTGYLCQSPDRDGLIEGIRFFLDRPERRAKSSMESLRFCEDSDSPYNGAAFARSWCRVFSVDEEGP